MDHPHAHTNALEATGLERVYGGTVALGGVDLTVRRAELHAVVGENGAGKSTLVRLLAGVEPRDGGHITILGRELPPAAGAAQVRAAGAAFIHQDRALVGDLTVAENVALVAGYPRRRGGAIDWSATRRQADTVLARMGVDLNPAELVAGLPVASQAAVAIARALALDARLLVLDEPTANLDDGDARTLHGVLRRLCADGVACVLVSHRLDEVLGVCDRVTVLRDGHHVTTVETAAVAKHDLVTLMLGRDPSTPKAALDKHTPTRARPHAAASRNRGPALLRLTNVTVGSVGPVSLDVAAGEVTAITGLAGGGHLNLAEAVFGLRRHRGAITHGGVVHRPRRAADAVAAGIAFVPADRAAAGVAANLSLRENLFLHPRGRIVNPAAEQRAATAILLEHDVRPPDPGAELSTLSGGNAQKVVLARCLIGRPRLLVLCEPTAAVDVGARRQIHDRLRRAAADGAAVLVASSDLEEVAEVADRAVVLAHGRVSRVLSDSSLHLDALRSALHADR